MKTSTLFFFLLLSLRVSCQTGIPSPSEFFPHPFGEQFTQHSQLLDYFRMTESRSANVKLITYGKTFQNRPLIAAVISSEDNLQKIEEIRLNHLRHTGMEKGQPMTDLDRAIVWMSFGVHGNEAGASESAMQLLYELISTKAKEEWLDNTIIILDPCLNPDGYNRYVQWYLNQSGSYINSETYASEHREPWPGGRGNHFLFDLNRDWAWATQIETRSRLRLYQKWMPHIHADYHEQFPNSHYYFAPAAEPYHKYISEFQRDFQVSIGKNHARYFDKKGWLYFTRETFDLFYPSYGDTYPMFNGAIGMTFEQPGHGLAGRQIKRQAGDTLSLQSRIDHQVVTALSNVEIASKHKEQLIKKFADYFSLTASRPAGKFKTYVVPFSNNDKDQIGELTKLLDLHGIQYGGLSKARKIRAYSYSAHKEVNKRVEGRDLLISAFQPKSTLVQVLFDPQSELSDSMTYDITAWGLPYAYGLNAFASEEVIKPDMAYKMDNGPSQGKAPEDVFAYIMPWESLQSARNLASLLKKGAKARVVTRSFKLDTSWHKPGTILFTRADNENKPELLSDLKEMADAIGNSISFTTTGLVEEGPDIGSGSMKLLSNPRIMVMGGEETSSSSFGQIWHFLDQDLKLPYTIVRVEHFNPGLLDEYNCLILPEGRYRSLSPEKLRDIANWIRKGGKCIAVGSAIRSFENHDSYSIKRYATAQSEQQNAREQEQRKLDRRLDPYHDRQRKNIPDGVPGAILKLKLDAGYSLSYGIGETYFTLKTTGASYEHLSDMVNAGYVEDELTYSGFIGSRTKERLKNSSTFFIQEMGRGKLVCLVDNPLFRGFWMEGKMIFSNAILFN